MSTSSNFHVSVTSVANRIGGRIVVAVRSGSTVLTVEEETTIEKVPVYVDGHCLSIPRELDNNARKLCNDGRSEPWDPTVRSFVCCLTYC